MISMIFLWISDGFPMIPIVFLWFSNSFRMFFNDSYDSPNKRSIMGFLPVVWRCLLLLQGSSLRPCIRGRSAGVPAALRGGVSVPAPLVFLRFSKGFQMIPMIFLWFFNDSSDFLLVFQ